MLCEVLAGLQKKSGQEILRFVRGMVYPVLYRLLGVPGMTTNTTRILAALIAVASVLAVLMAVCPQVLTGVPARESAARMMELVSEPSERSDVVRRRIKVKVAIIARLLDSELTLIQAASLFRHVNARPKGFEDNSWQNHRGMDAGEKICRQVINWVRAEGGSSLPFTEVEKHIEHLEGELQQHIRSHGRVQLDALFAHACGSDF